MHSAKLNPSHHLPPPSGRLRLELREPGGPTLLRRAASNTVLRSGAQLLADLFTGAASAALDGVALGVGEEPNTPPYERAGLRTTTPGGVALIEAAVTSLDPEEFEVEALPEEYRIRVSLRTLIPPGVGVSPDPEVESVRVSEAALGVLAEDKLSLARVYNRVIFEPFDKGRKHEIALYWEISFPYGPSA
ncbi:hypothetical protein PPSIR1_30280 [Plesiocystis pacifica SIR-1]|uniref:Uncharacterized protein n=1 Tax=Plesiocystis pacifica SIR-1 TaxID=391625 RepID=A6FZ35_9BACT|nr:hypothetical protein [Plesiocystis pacifica]EDM81190.1 hypothetical protein PPSIR1_30280 [Plesiocystis pacifica SIR-1]